MGYRGGSDEGTCSSRFWGGWNAQPEAWLDVKSTTTLRNREVCVVDLLEVPDREYGNVGFIETTVWYGSAHPVELDRLRGQVELEKVIVR